SGGGTGGHIYPAIAIAHKLKQQDPNISILFVGARGKMEMQKVPEAGYSIVDLNIAGFQRKKLWRNFLLPFRLLASLWKARKVLRKFRPDVVIGTGGYASAPILYMAAKQGIPTLIQEQNAIPGFTNRLLAKYVDKVCVAYEDMEQHFPENKLVITGNPVREDLLNLTAHKQEAYTHFGLAPEKPCLLVLGGSLGAKTINDSILQSLDKLTEAELQLIWVTGQVHFEVLQAQLSPQQHAAVKLYPFIESIHLAYAVADIVVARAGAGTIAELCIAQKPTIFVPSPNVTDDHQTKNVLPLVAKEAAVLVRDSEAMQTLAPAVIKLLQSEERRNKLAANIKTLARPQATTTIVQAMMTLVASQK
ncbi:MAG: undecaprenyldiphospho-muramoylpentapeptide beta-N-acetylglucosaminyltransferase, partial [Bacteroidota bacterium]